MAKIILFYSIAFSCSKKVQHAIILFFTLKTQLIFVNFCSQSINNFFLLSTTVSLKIEQKSLIWVNSQFKKNDIRNQQCGTILKRLKKKYNKIVLLLAVGCIKKIASYLKNCRPEKMVLYFLSNICLI